MDFKKTYKIVETGYQRNIYYFIDNKRVSSEEYFEKEIRCQKKGLKYNSSLLYTARNGRTVSQHSYN